MTEQPSWLTGLLAKHSNETLCAVHRLCAEIDRKGWTSANDIDSSAFHQRNCVGGAFQVLRSLGCVPIGWDTATEPRKHGRAIRKWGLNGTADGAVLIRQFRDASRCLIVQCEDDGQEVLAL